MNRNDYEHSRPLDVHRWSEHPEDKKSADKIKMMNNSEINELKTTLKVRSFEGPLEYLLD